MIPQKIFEQSYKWEYEKGITNNKNDKGKKTNDGVTLTFFNANCQKVLGVKPTEAKFLSLTKAEVKKFYDVIWQRMWCDKIENQVVAAVCFDFGLNSEFAKREIQEVLQQHGYKLAADNLFGPVTIQALNDFVKKQGVSVAVKKIIDYRQKYLTGLVIKEPAQAEFTAGWMNRIKSWRDFTTKWIDEIAQERSQEKPGIPA